MTLGLDLHLSDPGEEKTVEEKTALDHLSFPLSSPLTLRGGQGEAGQEYIQC